MGANLPDDQKKVQWGRVVGSPETQVRPEMPTGLRVKGHKTPQQKKRKRKSRDFNGVEAPRGSHKITILMGVFSLGLMILGSWFFLKDGNNGSVNTTSGEAKIEYRSLSDHHYLEVDDFTLFDIPPFTLAQKFAMTDDIEERLKLVRSPEIIRTRLDQYSEEALRGQPRKLERLGMVQDLESQSAVITATFPNGNERHVVIVSTKDGPRVDWDSYARYCDESWDDIFAGKVSNARVRVNIKPTSFFVREFIDREKWACLELYSPDFEKPLYGYCGKSSEEMNILFKSYTEGRKKVILDIKIDPKNLPYGQVEISSVVAASWLTKEVEPTQE